MQAATPTTLFTEYVTHLKNRKIPPARFSEYKKWLRYYLDFCAKYQVPDIRSEQVRLFCEKLMSKKQTEAQRKQAAHAVSLYFEMLKHKETPLEVVDALPGNGLSLSAGLAQSANEASLDCGEDTFDYYSSENAVALKMAQPESRSPQPPRRTYYVSETPPQYATNRITKVAIFRSRVSGEVRITGMGRSH